MYVMLLFHPGFLALLKSAAVKADVKILSREQLGLESIPGTWQSAVSQHLWVL